MSNKLIIFSAPSGSGKTTVVKHLLNKLENLAFSVSVTTRQKRPNEKNGKDYYFYSENDFLKALKNEEFLEYEEVYKGLFYGTLKSEVERLWSEGKTVIFDVDVIGGLNIKKFYGDQALADQSRNQNNPNQSTENNDYYEEAHKNMLASISKATNLV